MILTVLTMPMNFIIFSRFGRYWLDDRLLLYHIGTCLLHLNGFVGLFFVLRLVQEVLEAKFDKVNTHLVNMGNMIQKMENQLRDSLQQVYFDKAREITRALRSSLSKGDRDVQSKLANELQNALSNRRR